MRFILSFTLPTIETIWRFSKKIIKSFYDSIALIAMLTMLRKLCTLINLQSKDNKQYFIPDNKWPMVYGQLHKGKKVYRCSLCKVYFAKLTLLDLRIIQVNRASNILFMPRKYYLVYSSILGSIVPGPRQADAYSLICTSFLGSIVPGRE